MAYACRATGFDIIRRVVVIGDGDFIALSRRAILNLHSYIATLYSSPYLIRIACHVKSNIAISNSLKHSSIDMVLLGTAQERQRNIGGKQRPIERISSAPERGCIAYKTLL